MLLLVLGEATWRLCSRRGYDGPGAVTTLGLVLGNIPAGLVTAAIVGGVYAASQRIAPVHWPDSDWRVWVSAFVLVEFAYYWFHRASHRVRWLWASHAVHHSPEQMTLLSSFRLGWTNALSGGWLFYVPLVLAGFAPHMIIALLALDLRYQFFLHTEARISFGLLGWVLNTPSHHRAHHGRNAEYLDCNYGGMVIVFDRLFGTFRPERDDVPVEYGLRGRPVEANPVRLALREWRVLFGEIAAAGSFRRAVRIAAGPPGG
jgi:sterol desaturase/sphingolipid hydroxylase (fatty acid hydroxylase superfamily)